MADPPRFVRHAGLQSGGCVDAHVTIRSPKQAETDCRAEVIAMGRSWKQRAYCLRLIPKC
jgi:hypothetical protein